MELFFVILAVAVLGMFFVAFAIILSRDGRGNASRRPVADGDASDFWVGMFGDAGGSDSAHHQSPPGDSSHHHSSHSSSAHHGTGDGGGSHHGGFDGGHGGGFDGGGGHH